MCDARDSSGECVPGERPLEPSLDGHRPSPPDLIHVDVAAHGGGGAKFELTAHHSQESVQCVAAWRWSATFEPADRGLTRARPNGELLLRDTSSASSGANELAGVS